jgi:hypothetical protein
VLDVALAEERAIERADDLVNGDLDAPIALLGDGGGVDARVDECPLAGQ